MNKHHRSIILTIFIFLLCSCGEVTIEANPGEYDLLEYDLVDQETEYTVKMTMLEANSNEDWSAFLAFGMGDIKTKDKVEVYLQQPNRESSELIAGYRYVVSDQIVENEILLTKIPIGETIYWSISWDNDGLFNVSVAGQAEAQVHTNLSNLLGFVKVSSGEGKIHRY